MRTQCIPGRGGVKAVAGAGALWHGPGDMLEVQWRS